MKTGKTITTVAIALTLGVVYTGCKKDKNEVATPTTSATTGTTPTPSAPTTSSSSSSATAEGQSSICENSFNDIFTSISALTGNSSGLRSSCPTITVDTTPILSFPKTVTIDYGTGCNGKKGKLKAVFTGKFGSFGTIITITADSNYSKDSNKIHVGTHTIITGLSSSNKHKTFNLSVGGGKVGMKWGKVEFNSTKKIEWIEGDSTLDPSDDVYLITGTSSGTNWKGETFSTTITTPLRVASNCPWIESGVITMTAKKKTRTIDFGTGTCDNKATVTNDSTTFDITM